MANERRIDRDIRGKSASRSADAAIARLAAHQHGVVARGQLLPLGFGADAIDRPVALARLHPVHQGVYAVCHPIVSRSGAWMAAVLAAGPGAVQSHHSAAALWGIRETRRSTPDVIGPRRVERPRIHAAAL